VNDIIEHSPPGPDIRGPHNFFLELAEVPSLLALHVDSPVIALAEQLTEPGSLTMPWRVQVALNIPHFPHRPGLPHIDGSPPESDGRPGTSTMLVGVVMSEQRHENEGNLWVWPGSHLLHAAYFHEHGPDAFFEAADYPRVQLPEPQQICGNPGDVLLAHYVLGHNIGGNTSIVVRGAAYFRVKAGGHDSHWREFLQNPWLEYRAIHH
jgi:ectoine hydroxylase-related dioxygenase (phytanoyl-CoA dioxygenase family)